jgi:hypothetical protein
MCRRTSVSNRPGRFFIRALAEGQGLFGCEMPENRAREVCAYCQVVKIDIEGAECEAPAGAGSELLMRVDELVVDSHSDAPCRPADVAMAETAGLRGVELDLNHRAPLLHFKRGDAGETGNHA